MATKPVYTETVKWSPNSAPRGNQKPLWFLLHTQEGDGTAASLATYLGNPANQVSYHYTVDNAGNVVDVVDTDLSAWAVLDANPKTINLCFAGSFAAWSRQQWLDSMDRAIEIAAWLAVQDCRKYSLKPTVYPPGNYRAMLTTTGISDHRFVTQILGMGTHTDVGNGFPWDVFAGHVARFIDQGGIPVADPTLASIDKKLDLITANQGLILDQLGPGFDAWGPDGDLGKNAAGKRRTLRAGIAALLRKNSVPNG